MASHVGVENVSNRWLRNLFTGSVGSGDLNLDYSNPDLEDQLRKQGYGDLVDANPWKNLNYHKSGWQSFLGTLGFRTGADTAIENQQFQYNEYLQNVQNLASQNQYNSEQEKVARERIAGINPDLAGIGDASESGGLSEDTNNVLPNEGEENVPVQVANYVMTGISAAMGLAKDVVSLNQLKTAVNSGKLDNVQKMAGFIFDNALNFLSPQLPASDDVENDVFSSAASKFYDTFSGSVPRSLRRTFRDSINAFYSGLPTDSKAYEEWYNRMKNRQNAFSVASSDRYDDSNEVLMIISEELNKYADKAYRKHNENAVSAAELEGQEIESRGQFLDEYNPTTDAAATNATNRQTTQQMSFEADLNSVMTNITHRLKEIADKGGKGSWVASAALVVFSLMRMMSVNRTSGSSVNSKGVVTDTSSFSFGF